MRKLNIVCHDFPHATEQTDRSRVFLHKHDVFSHLSWSHNVLQSPKFFYQGLFFFIYFQKKMVSPLEHESTWK